MWKGRYGDSYIGEWKLGKTDGYGVHKYINGIFFYWKILKILKTFKKKKKLYLGDVYEGLFKNGLKHGEGVEKFSNNDYYAGLFVNGKPEG